MLQQNNNNNSLCLDMAHRELLQGCGRSAPLSFGTIGFGAIPLIKGLRAWAVSGGFNNRNRRKTAEDHSHQQPDTQRGWKTKENLSSIRSPGALVTVATLKGSEGVRQTQTRCLFLRAEGCSYICTVGNSRETGSRVAGQRTQPSSAELPEGQMFSSGHRRVSQDDAGGCKVKPQVIRKWRKSSKVFKSSERSSAESKDDGTLSKLEQRQGFKRDFTSQVEAQRTSDCPTSCLKAKHKHASSVQLPGNKSPGGSEEDNDEPNTSSKDSCGVSSHTDLYLRQDVCRIEATARVKHKSDIVADVNPNHSAKTKGIHLVTDVPKSKEFSPESEQLMQVYSNRNGATELKQDISKSYEVASIAGSSGNPSDDLLTCMEMEQYLPKSHSEVKDPDLGRVESRMDKNDNRQSKDVSHPEEVKKGKDLDMAIIWRALKGNDQGHDHMGMKGEYKASVDKDFVKTELSIHYLLMDKDEIEASDVISDNSPVEDPDLGHDHGEEENGSRHRLVTDSIKSDQFEVVIHFKEIEKDEALTIARTKSPGDSGQGHDQAGIEWGSKTRTDKESINPEIGQSKVPICCLLMGKDEDVPLDIASTNSPMKTIDLEGEESGSKPRMDNDLTENGPDQSEKDDNLEITKNPEEDPSQVHDPERVESESKSKMDKDPTKNKNDQPGETEKYEASGMTSTKNPLEDRGQIHGPARVETGPKARKDKNLLKYENDRGDMEKDDDLENTKSPKGLSGSKAKDSIKCENDQSDKVNRSQALDIGSTKSPIDDPGSQWYEHVQEVNSSGEEHWFGKSSQGSPKACLLNPNFTSTSNSTIATAPLALRQEEEEEEEERGGFRSLRPQAESQLVSEQEGGQTWSKVATNKRPVEVGEEEDDEFGVFMQAGEEQIWTEEFNELQQVPSGSLDGIGYKNSFDANEPMSWTSDWTVVQPFHQSDDTWAVFKQEDDIRGAESDMVPTGQWWSSPAVDNTHFTLSSLQNASCVFFEAFPSVESSAGDTDCVPTLKELLQRPTENNKANKPQNQSLLDGLQDLDRMIDVKYKGAESLSHKLLLQSLHLGSVNSDRVSSRKQATARFSPNLPTSNQQLAANAKRRLSYDINRNIMA